MKHKLWWISDPNDNYFDRVEYLPHGTYTYSLSAGAKAVFDAPTTGLANLWLQDPNLYVIGPNICTFAAPIHTVHIQTNIKGTPT